MMFAKTWGRCLATGVLAVAMAAQAAAVEWKTYESKKYGFSLKVPAEFNLENEEKGATWIYQPGSAAPATEAKQEKKRGFGINVGGIRINTSETEETTTSGSGGGLESALTVYVNWVWMPDVDSGTMYSTNKKSDEQNMDSPDPDYHELKVFDEKQGYAMEGNTYWYKEVDKTDGGEIHRWHIKSYGNKSAYTVGLCGTYEQFKQWAPIYEEMIKSWKLIPIEQ
jgi:hypothetical protein